MSCENKFRWPELRLPCDLCLFRPTINAGQIEDDGATASCEIYRTQKPKEIWESGDCAHFEGVEIRSKALLLGLAIGDALGVPVEFRKRGSFHITGMTGYGTYNQPPGTWSDDTSLALCLASSLKPDDLDLQALARSFVAWRDEAAFTPHGEVFDIGNATTRAITRMKQGIALDKCGGTAENDNGNGSLMRIAPLVFYMFNRPARQRYEITRLVSSLTHAHEVSVTACFIFLEYLLLLARRKTNAKNAYIQLQAAFQHYKDFLDTRILARYNRILNSDIGVLDEADIQSSGYVVHTLEASMWAFLRSRDYKDAVLAAVNLGDDSDTTGAVTGAMAALYYGISSIPLNWIEILARHKEIGDLAIKMPRWLYLPGA